MTNAASTPWTDNLVSLLKTHHEGGKSFREIAEIILAETGISLSRNAVIGKAVRLGLEKRGRNGNYNGNGRSKPGTKARRAGDGALAQKLRLGPPELKLEPFPAASPADVISRRVSILDLKAMECRYPDESGNPEKGIPHTFCGNPTEDGSSYCPAHAALVRGPGTKSERNAVNVARAA